MRRAMRTRVRVGLGYTAVALAVTVAWIYCARTEFDVDRLDVRMPSGTACSLRFCSIARLAEGRAFSPFVRRRLLADLARGLAVAVPDPCWSPLRKLLDEAEAPGWMRPVLRRQEWKPQDGPVLFCAYLLIGLSVLGFMLACRRLTTLVYDTPPWVADLAGMVLGVALLGGNGGRHYSSYPYDFPNAFVFTLALIGLLGRRWWFLPAFAAAAYSKETAVLLIAAHVLVAPERRSRRFWGTLGLLVVLFAGIRGWLSWRYAAPEPAGGFSWLGRNLQLLTYPIFYCWAMPFFAVGLARLWALRAAFPASLWRLCLLAIPLLGLAVFKGWFEELRQYLEVLPIVGLLVFHWCLHEAGLGHLLRARDLSPSSPPPPNDFAGPVGRICNPSW
jgi:hypothetical protein